MFKTALDFYVLRTGDRTLAQKLSPIVDGASNYRDNIYWSLSLEPFPSLTQKIVHTIALVGAPQHRMLYAQITLFGFFRILAVLDDDYSGTTLSYSHVENPLGDDPLPDTIASPIVFSREQILALKAELPTAAILQNHLSGISQVAQERQNRRALFVRAERARDALIAKLAEGAQGQPLTQEDMNAAVEAFRTVMLSSSD